MQWRNKSRNENPFPVFIRPSGRADASSAHEFRFFNYLLLERLAERFFRVLAALLAESLREAAFALADFLRPEPLFSPPPLCLFTVAHALRSASSSLTPFSS
jgi:hypothetical protein